MLSIKLTRSKQLGHSARKVNMKNYVYVYHVDSHMGDTDGQNALWSKWFESLGDKLVDAGNPFNPKSEARVSQGKVDMDTDSAAGYTVVKATDLEEAVTMAMSCPLANAAGCAVKVYETMPM
jgi:hypothetical protein